MKDSKLLSIPDVTGKTIVEACIYHVDPTGREILLRFSDSTELSIEVGESFAFDIRYYKDDLPDEPLLHVVAP